VEDRIRNAKDRGLRNLPCQDLHTNAAWVELATTLGRAVWLAGLMPIARSMTARLKILCSRAWCFTTDLGLWPLVVTSLTQAWIMAGLAASFSVLNPPSSW
jgi:hypothetical protein